MACILGIIDWCEIVEARYDVPDKHWFENLSLRGDCKADMTASVCEARLELDVLFWQIFTKGDGSSL